MNRTVRRAIPLVILTSALSFSVLAQPASKLARSTEGWQARRQQLNHSLQPSSVAAPTYGLESVQRQYWAGLGWLVSSQTTHSYQGLVRRETLDYDWDVTAFTPTYRATYGEDGLLSGTYYWDPSLPGYQPERRYEYEFMYHFFTGERIVAVATESSWSGLDWQPTERDVYTIGNDDQGGLIVVGGRTELWNGAAWVRDSDFQVEQQGDDVIETRRNWYSDTEWQNESRTRYPNTTVGLLYHRLVQLENQFRDMSEFSVALLALPDMEIAIWDAGAQDWVPDYRRVTELYDFSTGLPSGIAYQVWDGFDWALEFRQEVIYRFDGQPLQSKSLFPGDPGESGFIESFIYDDRGLPIDVITNLTYGGESLGYSRHLMTWSDLSVDVESPSETPVTHVLYPAYPNPFNPSTSIPFELGRAEMVTVTVHDLLGRRVATLAEGVMPAARHEVRFDATGLSTGLYMIRLQTPSSVQTRTVTLVK